MTRLQFLTYISQDFKRTDKNTEIYQALNDTIKDIIRRSPNGNFAFTSWAPCVVGQEDYPLASNLIHLVHPIKILDGSTTNDEGNKLEHINKEEYDRREPNPNRTSPSTGRPTAYCIWSQSIHVTPIPDKATYLLEIDWCRYTSDLNADADTPALGSIWDEVLKFGVLFRVYNGLGIDDLTAKYKALYDDPVIGVPALIRNDRALEGRAIGQVKNNNL